MPLKQTMQNIFFVYQYNFSINSSSREEVKSMFSGTLPFQRRKSNLRSQIIVAVRRQEKKNIYIFIIDDFFVNPKESN